MKGRRVPFAFSVPGVLQHSSRTERKRFCLKTRSQVPNMKNLTGKPPLKSERRLVRFVPAPMINGLQIKIPISEVVFTFNC